MAGGLDIRSCRLNRAAQWFAVPIVKRTGSEMRLLVGLLFLLACGQTGCSLDAQGRPVFGFHGFGSAATATASFSCSPGLEQAGVLCREPIRASMPPLIDHAVLRLAVFPSDEKEIPEKINLIAEEAAVEMKRYFPRLQIVERRYLELQVMAMMRDENFSGAGRMLGVDHFFAYKAVGSIDDDVQVFQQAGGTLRARSSGKMINVQTGTVVFQQTVEMTAVLIPPPPGRWWSSPESIKLDLMKEVIVTLFAHLEAALLPAPIGAMWVADKGHNMVKAHCVMYGGPAHDAGLQRGDQLVAIDGVLVHGVGDRVLQDSQLFSRDLVSMTIKRNGQEQTLVVRPLKRQSSESLSLQEYDFAPLGGTSGPKRQSSESLSPQERLH